MNRWYERTSAAPSYSLGGMGLICVLDDEAERRRRLFLPCRLSRLRLVCPRSDSPDPSSLESDVLEGLLDELVDELDEELESDEPEPDGDSEGVLLRLERSTFLRAVPK